MSLPYKVLYAEPPSLSEVIENSLDAPYIYSLKRLPFLQLTRILDQLTELSAFSNQLFAHLGNRTVKLSDRIVKLESRIKAIVEKAVATEQRIDENPLQPISREKNLYVSKYTFSSNLFTKATQPFFISSIYSTLPEVPPLEQLDVFRTDGQKSFQLFSYPEFFVEEWKEFITKVNDKKKKRGPRSSNEDIANRSSNIVNEDPGVFNAINHTGRERIKSPKIAGVLPSPFLSSPSVATPAVLRAPAPAPIDVAPTPLDVAPTPLDVAPTPSNAAPKPVSGPPPPPPPPAPPVAPPPPPPPSSSILAQTPSLKSPARDSFSPRTTTVASPDITGFLADIRGNQFKLKKAEVISRDEVKKMNEPVGVAAILMRRAALENSESDEDDNGDDWE